MLPLGILIAAAAWDPAGGLAQEPLLLASGDSSLTQGLSTATPPPHLLSTFTAGVPLRLARHVDFGQERLAPWFVDTLVGIAILRTGSFLHGPALGLSANLSADGGFAAPVARLRQLAVTPAYLAYTAVGTHSFLKFHAGIPAVFGDTATWGLEGAAAFGYRLRAGVGLLSELTVATFGGSESTLHPLVSIELGAFVDYEVLP